MAKKNPGYQIEERIAEAIREHCVAHWCKPIEDVVAASILHYLDADDDHRLQIRSHYTAWTSEMQKTNNDAAIRDGPAKTQEVGN